MKPFHYNQDPLYAASASILTGQQLTEEVAEFKNQGFILVGNPKGNPFLRNDVNSSIKSAVNKLSDVTWNLVTDIYGKRDNGAWAGDWILQRKGGDAWLTIKDGGAFKAHGSISSVLSFFEDEGMEEMEDEGMEEEIKVDEFASLLGKQVHHGSPGYPTKEVIASITPHQTKKGSFEVEFESGAFDVLSQGELYDLMNGVEVFYHSPHGGKSVIELQEEEMEEGHEDLYSQKMIKNQLQTLVRNSNTCLQMIEDDRKFPEWAQSEIAVAEAGIVSVTEYMESHTSDDNIDEASQFKMGTATITAPGNPLHGKQANIFHKFDDGRINVQYVKSDKKGDVLNITLNKGQYKLDEAAILEASSDELSALSKVMLSMGASYGDINAVRSKLDSETSAQFLIAIASALANDTDAFNAFVKTQSK
jgi:hypothetical protein